MTGWKDWQIGEVVTESDFQNLVQDQVVQRYADASARTSALGTAVAEGMVSYLEDTNSVQVYNGSDWVAVGDGDITSVTAGTGLTGGGTAGDVTLSADYAAIGSAITVDQTQVTGLTTGTAGQLVVSAGTAGVTYEDAEATLVAGTQGYTALSNGTAGITYQPVSHNYIINGAFDVWQRGTSFTSTLAGDYGADRWQHYRTSSVHSRVSSTLDGFNYAYRMQRPSGETFTGDVFMGQAIESAGGLPLVGQPFTVSLYARAGANFSAASLQARLQVTPDEDEKSIGGTNRTTVETAAFSVTTSWQRFTFSGTVPTTASSLPTRTIGVQIFWTPTGTAGADDWVEVTGVQLEAGSVATPFKRHAPSLQGELAACRRYYYRTASTNAFAVLATGFATGTTQLRAAFKFPVTMRATPTLVASGDFEINGAGSVRTNVTSLAGARATPDGLDIEASVASGLLPYNAGNLRSDDDITAYIEFTGAEL